MKIKAVVPRARANLDIEEAVQHYLADAGASVALAFVDQLERAVSHLARNPATGSPRYAHELNLPGLRHWPLKDYPYLIFYIEQDRHIEIWRVLHAQRDIPMWMQDQA